MTESPMYEPPGRAGPFFVKLGGIASIRDSVLAAALTYAHTHDVPLSTGAGLANEVRTRVRKMTDHEVAVFELLRHLAAGALYQVWVDQDVLVTEMVETFDGETSRPRCLGLLRSMKKRGLLEESSGAWKAVW